MCFHKISIIEPYIYMNYAQFLYLKPVNYLYCSWLLILLEQNSYDCDIKTTSLEPKNS